jgi:hypothetical protein
MDGWTRRGFLRRTGQTAVALGAAALAGEASVVGAAEEPGATTKATGVPMAVRLQPSWLSWVSSVAGCLNALGTVCDNAEVAGHSGYAFLSSVADKVDVSGPTRVNFPLLASGLLALGRSVLVFTGATCMKGKSDDFRFAYDLVAGEIAAGRPCVIWGAHVPEFGVAVGVEDGRYMVESMTEKHDPIPFDKLSACVGVQVLAFPTAAGRMGIDPDSSALHRALACLGWQTGDPKYASGQAGYDKWIAALESGEADPFGNSYNAQCWTDAKRMAREFVRRLAGRNAAARRQLDDAAAAYGEVVEAMEKVAGLFPFPDGEKRVGDPAIRRQAVEPLRAAKGAEAKAATALAAAAAVWPAYDPTKEAAMPAPCGIDCAKCDMLARGECAGCRGDRRHQWSGDCGIRRCCTDEKHLAYCSQCGEFPCGPLRDWAAAYPHHGSALERLRAMREAGGNR